jgi:hypothetical protein
MASFFVFPLYSTLSAVNTVVPGGASAPAHFAVDEFEHHQGWAEAQVTAWLACSGGATISTRDIGLSMNTSYAPGEELEVAITGSGASTISSHVMGTAAMRAGYKIWEFLSTNATTAVVALQFDEV